MNLGEGNLVASRRGTRGDIQGLRAVAVIAVILNHLLDWPKGGFTGVDVFFVISGFLITGILLKDSERALRLRVATFYRRRVRRIIPVAVTVLVATISASYYLFNSSRGDAVLVDGVWALFFASNWHFAAVGTDYWAPEATSPLQHFWSLAVEEQFYLVWPWFVVLGAAVWRRGRRALAWGAGITVGISFAYSVWHTDHEQTWAYFSTLDRAWELAVGALLAIETPRLTRMPARWRPWLGWAGLGGIGLGLFIVQPDGQFPGPWAALPVMATAATIAAGTGGSLRLRVIDNWLGRYVGDISYSLYLWHFPVMILLLAFYPHKGVAYVTASVGLVVAVSILSFHLLEDPVRRSSWLEREPRRGTKPKAPVGPLAFACAVFALMLSALALMSAGGYSSESADKKLAVSGLRPGDVGALSTKNADPRLEHLSKRLEDAVAAEQFPSLTPALDSLGISDWRHDLASAVGCYAVDQDNVGQCVTGRTSARHEAVVIGDSFAMAYMPGITEALTPAGWRVQQLTLGLCPSWDVSMESEGGGRSEDCDRHRAWVREVVKEKKPDLAILVSSYGDVRSLASGAHGASAAAEVTKGLRKTLSQLDGTVERTVIIEPPPRSISLQDCVTNVGEPSDCTTAVDSDFLEIEAAEEKAAEKESADYVRTLSWFCTDRGACPGFVGSTPIRVDNGHLTIEYSRQIAPLIRSSILGRTPSASGG